VPKYKPRTCGRPGLQPRGRVEPGQMAEEQIFGVYGPRFLQGGSLAQVHSRSMHGVLSHHTLFLDSHQQERRCNHRPNRRRNRCHHRTQQRRRSHIHPGRT